MWVGGQRLAPLARGEDLPDPRQNVLELEQRRIGARIESMKRRDRTPLLSVGHEAEWAVLNEEKRRVLTLPADTPIEELLRRGQHLSAQAAWLLRAVEQANGHARTKTAR